MHHARSTARFWQKPPRKPSNATRARQNAAPGPRLPARRHAGQYSVLIGESNVAIDPAIGGYGVADIYLGEFSPHRNFLEDEVEDLEDLGGDAVSSPQ